MFETSRVRPKSASYPRLKNSKRTSRSQFTVIQNQKSKKMDRVARRDPLTRTPGALKVGTLLKLSTFLSQLKGDHLAKKQIFEKKSHNAEKQKGGPFGIFQHPLCRKTGKKLKGGPFGEKVFSAKKVSQCRKKFKGGTLWSRPVWHVTRENRKNLFGSVR